MRTLLLISCQILSSTITFPFDSGFPGD